MDSCSHCVDCLVPNSDLHLKQRGVIIEDILWRRKTRFMVPCLTACVSSSIRFFALCEIPYNPYCKETAWHSGRLYSTIQNRIKWCLCSCRQYDNMKNQFCSYSYLFSTIILCNHSVYSQPLRYPASLVYVQFLTERYMYWLQRLRQSFMPSPHRLGPWATSIPIP